MSPAWLRASAPRQQMKVHGRARSLVSAPLGGRHRGHRQPWCRGMGLGVCRGWGRLGLVLIPVPSCPQSKLHMEGFRSLKEGEAVEFTFKKSSKGLESIRVTGPGGVFCIGSERRPKGKSLQKRRSKGDR